MTPEKVIRVLDLYEKELPILIEAETDIDRFPLLAHLQGMVPQIKNFVRKRRMEKAFRWLGFLQGALWAMGIHTIHGLRDHNKP